MSKFSTPFFRIQAGIFIAPELPFADFEKPIKLSAEFSGAASTTEGYAARVIFGASGQTVQVAADGQLEVVDVGVRQVETFQVTAAAGATSDGNLTVTITKAGLAGSPLALAVPLRSNLHTTPALIVQAIKDAINANAACAAVMEATFTSDVSCDVRAKYPEANDATFNIAITAGLGVSAFPTTTNSVAGVAGVVIERMGSANTDAFGVQLNGQVMTDLVASCPADSDGTVTFGEFPEIVPGGAFALSSPAEDGLATIAFEGAGQAILDILVLSRR